MHCCSGRQTLRTPSGSINDRNCQEEPLFRRWKRAAVAALAHGTDVVLARLNRRIFARCSTVLLQKLLGRVPLRVHRYGNASTENVEIVLHPAADMGKLRTWMDAHPKLKTINDKVSCGTHQTAAKKASAATMIERSCICVHGDAPTLARRASRRQRRQIILVYACGVSRATGAEACA